MDRVKVCRYRGRGVGLEECVYVKGDTRVYVENTKRLFRGFHSPCEPLPRVVVNGCGSGANQLKKGG